MEDLIPVTTLQDKNKMWLLRKKDKPDYLPLNNQDQAYQGPLNNGLSNKRNEISTDVNSDTVTPNPKTYI